MELVDLLLSPEQGYLVTIRDKDTDVYLDWRCGSNFKELLALSEVPNIEIICFRIQDFREV